MEQYLQLLRHTLNHGVNKANRTGIDTISTFGYQMRFNLEHGFPLVTTKKCHLKSIIHELLWFLQGDTNIKYLQDNGVRIWNEWADPEGNLGPVYGKQWRCWETKNGTIDQITDIINELKQNPNSRRLLVNSWNVGDLPNMALMPCHVLFQFYVCNGNLSCQLYQRSADIFLGIPFNIASYSLLTMMIAQVTGLNAYEFIHTIGDAHLYVNHLEQAKTQIERTPFAAPKMQLNPNVTDIFQFQYDDFTLTNYQHHPHISAPIAV